MKEIFIPFDGFYESYYSDGIDHEMDMHAEYVASDDCCEFAVTDQCEAYNVLLKHMNWRQAYEKMARNYVDSFALYINNEADLTWPFNLKFKELVSPREYNFTTDRILCEIDEAEVQMMHSMVSLDRLDETCRERHTSYSGFHSFYNPDYRTWPTNALEWDANQLETLLIAFIKTRIADFVNWRDSLQMICAENNDFGNAYDHGLDWQAAEAEFKSMTAGAQ